MGSYSAIANSLWLWLACGSGVVLVLVQAVLMTMRTLKAGKTLGITDSQVRAAVKSSATSSIGPTLAIVAGMVSLLVAMGGPISWFRLSYIGSVAYELMAAGFGAKAMNVTLGGPDMTALAFACGVWVMTIGSIGWVLFTAIATPKLDKFRNVLAGGRKEMIPVISVAAMCGAFSYLTIDRVIRFDSQMIAALVGFAVMAFFTAYNKKAEKRWIREWSFCISMFIGMAVSIMF